MPPSDACVLRKGIPRMKHPLFATTAAASIDHEARAQAACLSDEVRAGQGLGFSKRRITASKSIWRRFILPLNSATIRTCAASW
jgi:hypothetical protein